ncbi:hypothetical protein ACWTV9_00015 [Clostridioides difficile]
MKFSRSLLELGILVLLEVLVFPRKLNAPDDINTIQGKDKY